MIDKESASRQFCIPTMIPTCTQKMRPLRHSSAAIQFRSSTCRLAGHARNCLRTPRATSTRRSPATCSTGTTDTGRAGTRAGYGWGRAHTCALVLDGLQTRTRVHRRVSQHCRALNRPHPPGRGLMLALYCMRVGESLIRNRFQGGPRGLDSPRGEPSSVPTIAR